MTNFDGDKKTARKFIEGGETNQLMLQLGDNDNKGYLNEEDCLNFPKEELRIIDQLWVKYSEAFLYKNKFGLTGVVK